MAIGEPAMVEVVGPRCFRQLPGAGGMVAVAVGVGDRCQCQALLPDKGHDFIHGAAVDGQRTGAGIQEISQIVAAVKKLFDFQWADFRRGFMPEQYWILH